jgi:hypothetical protein
MLITALLMPPPPNDFRTGHMYGPSPRFVRTHHRQRASLASLARECKSVQVSAGSCKSVPACATLASLGQESASIGMCNAASLPAGLASLVARMSLPGRTQCTRLHGAASR